MKRIVLWFMSTLTVVTLLFGYHTSTSSQLFGGSSSVLASRAGGGATTPGTTSGSTGGTTSGSTGGTTSGSTGGTTGSTATVTGDSTDTRWGPVQVQVTVANGTITDVNVVDYPSGNGRDQQINSRALPILVKETLDAQSANIDMVSGATVTSEGYLGSLQSALDQAGL
jgi:uncharacterized protein with FMN-binding domain